MRSEFVPPEGDGVYEWRETQPSSDEIRLAVRYMKLAFLSYRNPPLELPPDSLMEDVIRDIWALATREPRQDERLRPYSSVRLEVEDG